MARNKVILVDADVISHFMGTGHIDDLTSILSPHQLFIVENVYREATRHPSDTNRKQKVDDWLARCHGKVQKILFPDRLPIKMEYYKLKHDNHLLGDGECACMAMARFGQETIASSNFRDVVPYCTENHIEYIGVMDILLIALKKKYWDVEQCNQFIADAKVKNDARFPVYKIEKYKSKIDLSAF